MYVMRNWSVRHARSLEWVYDMFADILLSLDPLWRRIGYARAEKPISKIEAVLKGFMFDCQMCGQCVLSHTGMSCPMNCPKSLRNGPCGGVRSDGGCEIDPAMRCVWVAAFEGSQRMRESSRIESLNLHIDGTLKGSSSWLRVARQMAEFKRTGVRGNDSDLMGVRL